MRETDEIRSLLSSADPAADVDVTPQVSADELIARAAEPAPTRRRVMSRRRVWSLVGAGAVTMAAAAAIVMPVVGHHGVKPAYAVTVQKDGRVRVDIAALTNAANFQRRLERAGVPTEIEHLPAGMHCARSEPVRYFPLTFGIRPLGHHKARLVSFVIDPDEIKPGETLVVEAHGTKVTRPPAGVDGFYIAKAPHRCTPVR